MNRPVVSVLATTALFVAASAPVLADELPFERSDETQLASGVTLTTLTASDPQRTGWAVEVDLDAAGVRLVTTASNGDDELDTESQTTLAFADAQEAVAAVNASFYDPCCAYFFSEPRDIRGLAIADGELVSEPEPKFAALVVDRTGTPRIVEGDDQPAVGSNDAWVAVAGHQVLLQAGEVVAPGAKSRHPRTAVGISADSRTVWLLVIDGRQPDWSEGATLSETAEWLRALGASEGLNLDGGGSTTLVTTDEDGDRSVRNRPSTFGRQRQNANALGVVVR